MVLGMKRMIRSVDEVVAGVVLREEVRVALWVFVGEGLLLRE